MAESRHIKAIMFSDIVGFSELMGKNEAEALRIVKLNKQIHLRNLKTYNGRLVKELGDGMIVTFDSIVEAVHCGLAMLKDIKTSANFQVRIGIHLGEIVRKKKDIFGDGVNITSRIEALANPDQLLVSDTVYRNLKNIKGFKFTDAGRHSLKNIEIPIQLYAVDKDIDYVLPKSSTRGKSKYILAGTFFILVIGMLYLMLTVSGANNHDKNSIAVLPLINITANNDDLEYFSDGLTQELIDELAKIESFTITAFSSTFHYKKTKKPNKTIAKELEVEYLISGSSRIFSQKQMIKLSIELVNPYSGERIWNKTFEKNLDNAQEIQVELARDIANILDIKLSENENKRLNEINTVSGEAFNFFLKAKAENFKLSQDGFENCHQYLTKAIELDPNYTQAHTLMGWNYMLQNSTWFEGYNASSFEVIDNITHHLESAIKSNASSSDIYLVRGGLNLYWKSRIYDAKKDVDLALDLNSWPKVPTNYCICTVVSTYVAKGEFIQARELAKVARDVDPGNVFIYWDMANIHMCKGEYKKAQALFEQAVEVVPIPFFYFFLGLSYYHDHQYSAAIQYFNKAYQFSTTPIPLSISYLSNAYFQLGDIKKSNQYYEELAERIKAGEKQLSMRMAVLFAARKDVDKTIEWLNLAYQNKDHALAYMMNVDPIFRPFYENAAFKRIRTEMQYYK